MLAPGGGLWSPSRRVGKNLSRLTLKPLFGAQEEEWKGHRLAAPGSTGYPASRCPGPLSQAPGGGGERVVQDLQEWLNCPSISSGGEPVCVALKNMLVVFSRVQCPGETELTQLKRFLN